MSLSNSSLCACKWRNVLYSYVQIPFGAGALLFNLVIVATIVRYYALRNTYYLLCGLAVADMVEGVATFVAGIWRALSLKFGWACLCVSKVHCMALPQTWLWRWSEIATAFMLLAVSCDRWLAVAHPTRHMTWETGFAKAATLAVFILATLNTAVGWVDPIRHRDQYMPAFCSSSAVFYKPYYQFNKYLGSLASAFSVVVYGAVVIKYRQITKGRVSAAQKSKNTHQLDKHLKSQQKLTKTLAISSACTLLLDAIPRAYGIYIDVNKSANIFGSNKAVVFQLTKLNGISNFFLYALRHKDINKGMRSLVTCKQLPRDLKLWDLTKVQERLKSRRTAVTRATSRAVTPVARRRSRPPSPPLAIIDSPIAVVDAQDAPAIELPIASAPWVRSEREEKIEIEELSI